MSDSDTSTIYYGTPERFNDVRIIDGVVDLTGLARQGAINAEMQTGTADLFPLRRQNHTRELARQNLIFDFEATDESRGPHTVERLPRATRRRRRQRARMARAFSRSIRQTTRPAFVFFRYRRGTPNVQVRRRRASMEELRELRSWARLIQRQGRPNAPRQLRTNRRRLHSTSRGWQIQRSLRDFFVTLSARNNSHRPTTSESETSANGSETEENPEVRIIVLPRRHSTNRRP